MITFKQFINETKLWLRGDIGSYELLSHEFYLKGKEVRLNVMINDKLGAAIIKRIGNKNEVKRIEIRNINGTLLKNKKIVNDITNVLLLNAETKVDYSKIKVKGFTTKTTNMPYYDNILNNQQYFIKNKNIKFEVKLMDPDTYLFLTKAGFKIFNKKEVWKQDEKAEHYAKLIKKGEKFPMLVLDYSMKTFTQEGRHRALAANISNIKKVPVMIVKKV